MTQSPTKPIARQRKENDQTQDPEAETETPEAEAGTNQQEKVSKAVDLQDPMAIMTAIIVEIGKEIEDMLTEATGSKKETIPRISRQEFVLSLKRFQGFYLGTLQKGRSLHLRTRGKVIERTT